MSSQTRRSATSSSSSVKRPAVENAAKVAMGPPHQPKKRAALSNLTNHSNAGRNPVRPSGSAGNQVPFPSATSKLKKGSSAHVGETGLQRNPSLVPSIVKPTASISHKIISLPRNDVPPTAAPLLAPLSSTSNSLPRNERTTISFVPPTLAPCSMNVSPDRSDTGSVSLDETMSTTDSLNSPDVEYIDNADAAAVASLERRTCSKLYISEDADTEKADSWKRNSTMGTESIDKIVDIDENHENPQLCATMACDIYKHLRLAETKKRPSTDFIEVVQKDVNASMRAILIDWLVEVAEEYRLVPDTLYLTVNYIDRYLSGNVMNRQRLQLLGVACMLVAAKYEEICAPQVEEFCYITDNTYFKDEVLQMESSVLNYLKFEMTAPTTKCFLRRFVRVAQRSNEVPSLQFECLANYVAELSLLEYSFLCYSPSLMAASAVFLALFILFPTNKPWNATLSHYTQYQPSELCCCVKDLHQLFCNSHNSSLPAIREKYSQHKYKFVAKKHCPPTIPSEFFLD